MVFSSIAALMGEIGQTAYSCSNHFADIFVRQRNRNRPGHWISVNWDLWQGTDVGWGKIDLNASTEDYGAEQAAKMVSLARKAISLDEGVAAFDWLLSAPPIDQVIVSPQRFSAKVGEWLNKRLTPQMEASTSDLADSTRPDLDTPYAEPVGAIEATLSRLWGEVLGVSGLGRDDDFFELGGHSLLAVKLIPRVHGEFAVRIAIADVFASPTIRKIAELVTARHNANRISGQPDSVAGVVAPALS
jgi:acyl carrier protein